MIKGCSSWHGTHHDAQTLTIVGAPFARSDASKPATPALVPATPSIAGKLKGGTGLPTSAEGSLDGSPLWRANQKRLARPAKTTSGRARPHCRQSERGAAAV